MRKHRNSEARASPKGLARDDRGQALAMFGLFLAFVGTVLLFGAIGTGMAYSDASHVQAAADAAALAAARTAAPSGKTTVRYHERVCNAPNQCTNYPQQTIELSGDLKQLLPDKWVTLAGCDARSDKEATGKGAWRVCDEFGAAEHQGWSVDPATALKVARSYLDTNLKSVVKEWKLESFSVTPNGRVQLTVQATLQGNMLSAISKRPVRVRVTAWAEPDGEPVK